MNSELNQFKWVMFIYIYIYIYIYKHYPFKLIQFRIHAHSGCAMREWTLAVLEARMIQPKWQVILVQPSFDSLSHGLAELNLGVRGESLKIPKFLLV